MGSSTTSLVTDIQKALNGANNPPGYLSQFDMVLSISQDAMNRQLRHLYDTPLPGQPLPDPTKIKRTSSSSHSSKETPGIEYLISHTLNIDAPNGLSGLSAKIGSPEVSWDSLSIAASPGRTIKMTFPFLEGSTFDSWVVDTKAKVRDRRNPPPLKKVSASVEGYSMSFEASIGRSDIQKVEEELLHPDVQSSIEAYVNSQDYLVSSLFCLFESSQIANTLTVADARGNPIGEDQDIGSWALLMTSHFSEIKKPGKEGKNPFVLGYGVVQNPARTVPPPEFAPKSFQFSTTAEGIPTLNFLLLTGDRKVDVNQDPSAGRFPRSFFTTINSAKHDGVLAMCSNQITNDFILKVIVPAFWFGVPSESFIPGHAITTASTNQNIFKESCSRHITWDAAWHEWDDVGANYQDKWDGEGALNVYWTSDCQINPALVAPGDVTRTMYVNVSGELKFNYHRQSVAKGLSNWAPAFDATLKVPYSTRLNITPGKDGAWIVKRDESMTHFPEFDHNGKIVLDESPGGNFWKQSHGVFAAFPDLDQIKNIVSSIKDIVSGLAQNAWEDLSSEMNKDLQGLATKIIMPAGDVFMFDGLNTDIDGNGYSSITYSTISGGERLPTHKAVKKPQSGSHLESKMINLELPATRLDQSESTISALNALMDSNQTFIDSTLLNGNPSPGLVNAQKSLGASLKAAMNAKGALVTNGF